MVQQAPIRSMRRYVRGGLSHVAGWFSLDDIELTQMFLVSQLRSGLHGNVAEIGVHHGRCFLLLANSVRDDEEAVALDVFEDQEKNLDRSGRGERDIFEGHVARWADPAKVRILQKSSLDISPEQAADAFGKVRFFSVDGGHTAEITEHDLRLAETVVVPDGIVMLDDILNPHWTGVITGFAAYLRDGGGLVPFAVSDNKLFLTTSTDTATLYRRQSRAKKDDLVGKSHVEFFGHLVDVYGRGSARWRESREVQRARDVEFDRLTRRLEEAEAMIVSLKASRSWRATAPLRAVNEAAHRMRLSLHRRSITAAR